VHEKYKDDLQEQNKQIERINREKEEAIDNIKKTEKILKDEIDALIEISEKQDNLPLSRENALAEIKNVAIKSQ
jgi:predicted phage gp36 major capsid-like protein